MFLFLLLPQHLETWWEHPKWMIKLRVLVEVVEGVVTVAVGVGLDQEDVGDLVCIPIAQTHKHALVA